MPFISFLDYYIELLSFYYGGAMEINKNIIIDDNCIVNEGEEFSQFFCYDSSFFTDNEKLLAKYTISDKEFYSITERQSKALIAQGEYILPSL
jgi:hypothetical protein